MGKFFNKKTYFVFLVLHIAVAIGDIVKGNFGIPRLLTLIVGPIIYTFIWLLGVEFLSSIGRKKIGKNGFTKLMSLSSNGEINEIKNQYNTNSSDINAQNKGGYTALMYASSGGHLKVVELLIDFGADKELMTKKGNNALFFAKKNSHTEIISILQSDSPTTDRKNSPPRNASHSGESTQTSSMSAEEKNS